MKGFCFEGSLNTELNDEDYEERTGVGVACDYYTHEDGRAAFALTALVNDGERDAGWGADDFAAYWRERGDYWRAQAWQEGEDGGDVWDSELGKRELLDAVMRKRGRTTVSECVIVLGAAVAA